MFHLAERFFNEIIECSDVGIDDEIESEMKSIKAYGLQATEVEDTNEYTLNFDYNKLADYFFKTANKKYCLKRNRKVIYDLVKKLVVLFSDVWHRFCNDKIFSGQDKPFFLIQMINLNGIVFKPCFQFKVSCIG